MRGRGREGRIRKRREGWGMEGRETGGRVRGKGEGGREGRKERREKAEDRRRLW